MADDPAEKTTFKWGITLEEAIKAIETGAVFWVRTTPDWGYTANHQSLTYTDEWRLGERPLSDLSLVPPPQRNPSESETNAHTHNWELCSKSITKSIRGTIEETWDRCNCGVYRHASIGTIAALSSIL